MEAEDFYLRLGVDRSASLDEIKRAYLSLVRQFTPERAPNEFKRIREAYETLGNASSRKQYDTRPSPRVTQLLERASRAMKSQDYEQAEQAYKQALLEDPDLHWVRNLLGLCFLYAKQPEKAIAQYERLLASGVADASVHGNAAQAYRQAKRPADAQREFEAAMRAAGDQAAEYGLALIDMLAENGDAKSADDFARAHAESAERGSSEASEYGSKRIELALLLGTKAKIPDLVDGVSLPPRTEEHRRYAAFALGKVARKLIAAEAFEPVISIAKAAKALQPSDPDYDGLEQAGALLYRNDFDEVKRLLNTHVSFAPKGWLHPLRQTIEQYCKTHAVFNKMRPIDGPPTLYRLNGFGTAFYGKRDVDPQTGTHVGTRYITCLYVPVAPIGCYRVRPAPKRGWYFLGEVPFGLAQKAHLAIVCAALAIWMLYGVTKRDTIRTTSPLRFVAPTASNVAGSDGHQPADSATPSPLGLYYGAATNTSVSGSPRSAVMRITFSSWENSPNGYLFVDPPLGGSGKLYAEAKNDSVRLTSVSPSGDTISWLGLRSGTVVSGDFVIVGGRSAKQHGTWRIALTSGSEIPERVGNWR